MTKPMLARPLAVLAVLAVAACADAPLPVAPPQDAVTPTLSPVTTTGAFMRAQDQTDRVIIELNGPESGTFAREVQRLGGRIERRHPDADNLVVASGLSSTAVATLAARSDVASIAHDARIQWIPQTATAQHRHGDPHVQVVGPDQSTACFFADFQWNMRVSAAADAWTKTPAGDGTTVYVLDTGIDPNHIDLDGRVDLAHSRSFAEREPGDIRDYNSHGTFVSAIVASNGICVASVAPLAKVVAVKVLDGSGSGAFSDVIAGVMYAADQGADVINLSLGSVADLKVREWRQLVHYFQSAVRYAQKKGAVVVAAAGNGDENFVGMDLSALPRDLMFVPAELDGVVAVGATAPVGQVDFDRLATYSNYGFSRDHAGGVDIFAPGGDFVAESEIFDLVMSACSEYTLDGDGEPTICPGNDFYFLDFGTSVAAPVVSGAAAVTRSLIRTPRKERDKVVDCLLRSADQIGPRSMFGYGRVNVLKSAQCAASGRGRNGVAN